jgi:hypothetical protein
MITLFNIKRKATNDLMREQLRLIVVPRLRERGFLGKLPSFRRIRNGTCETLDVQFNKYGGSFAINLKVIEAGHDFMKTPYGDLKALRSQRLGSRRKRMENRFYMDHWFRFLRGFIFYWQAYREAAEAAVSLLDSEADAIYQDLSTAIERGVYCIHLDRS